MQYFKHNSNPIVTGYRVPTPFESALSGLSNAASQIDVHAQLLAVVQKSIFDIEVFAQQQ